MILPSRIERVTAENVQIVQPSRLFKEVCDQPNGFTTSLTDQYSVTRTKAVSERGSGHVSHTHLLAVGLLRLQLQVQVLRQLASDGERHAAHPCADLPVQIGRQAHRLNAVPVFLLSAIGVDNF